jgi:hypothetical protein
MEAFFFLILLISIKTPVLLLILCFHYWIQSFIMLKYGNHRSTYVFHNQACSVVIINVVWYLGNSGVFTYEIY